MRRVPLYKGSGNSKGKWPRCQSRINLDTRANRSTKPPQQVRFAPDPAVPKSRSETLNIELSEIQNLCATLARCSRKVCSMGFLKCSKDYRHEFYSIREASSACFSGKSTSLFEL